MDGDFAIVLGAERPMVDQLYRELELRGVKAPPSAALESGLWFGALSCTREALAVLAFEPLDRLPLHQVLILGAALAHGTRVLAIGEPITVDPLVQAHPLISHYRYGGAAIDEVRAIQARWDRSFARINARLGPSKA